MIEPGKLWIPKKVKFSTAAKMGDHYFYFILAFMSNSVYVIDFFVPSYETNMLVCITNGKENEKFSVLKSVKTIFVINKCYPCSGHTDWLSCVRFSPSGEYVATSSGDRSVRVWSEDRCIKIFDEHTQAC